MGLHDAIKEMKEQLAEEDKKEVEEIVEEVVEEKPEEVEDEVEEEKPKEEPEEKPDNSAFAKLRRDAAAYKRRAEEAERANEELRTKPKEEAEVKEEAPRVAPEIEEMVMSHRMSKAEQEFQSLEGKFRASNPEYDSVAEQYANALAQSIKVQNPRMSNAEVAERTKKTILLKASQYVQEGYDPIEEIYQEAKELGFSAKKKEAAKEQEEIKPDMKKVSANRARSTNMAATNGRSQPQMTQAAAADLTVAEWSKLSKEEKRKLMYN